VAAVLSSLPEFRFSGTPGLHGPQPPVLAADGEHVAGDRRRAVDVVDADPQAAGVAPCAVFRMPGRVTEVIPLTRTTSWRWMWPATTARTSKPLDGAQELLPPWLPT